MPSALMVCTLPVSAASRLILFSPFYCITEQMELQRQIAEAQETKRREDLQLELERKQRLHQQFMEAEDAKAALRLQQQEEQRLKWEQTVQNLLEHEQNVQAVKEQADRRRGR